MAYDPTFIKTAQGDLRQQAELAAAKQRDNDSYRRSIMNQVNRDRRAKGLPPRPLKDFM